MPNMMESIPDSVKIIKKQLEEWFSELLYRTDNIEDHFQIVDRGMSVDTYFYTRDNRYSITASETYLGCQVSSRKPRAGEDWTRGNDLPDGKFNEETWNEIKNAIISYELVKIAKKEKQTPEHLLPDKITLASDNFEIPSNEFPDGIKASDDDIFE